MKLVLRVSSWTGYKPFNLNELYPVTEVKLSIWIQIISKKRQNFLFFLKQVQKASLRSIDNARKHKWKTADLTRQLKAQRFQYVWVHPKVLQTQENRKHEEQKRFLNPQTHQKALLTLQIKKSECHFGAFWKPLIKTSRVSHLAPIFCSLIWPFCSQSTHVPPLSTSDSSSSLPWDTCRQTPFISEPFCPPFPWSNCAIFSVLPLPLEVHHRLILSLKILGVFTESFWSRGRGFGKQWFEGGGRGWTLRKLWSLLGWS